MSKISLEEKELITQIEALKSDLDRLISIGARFDEIYSLSRKLDSRIVRLYRVQLAGDVI